MRAALFLERGLFFASGFGVSLLTISCLSIPGGDCEPVPDRHRRYYDYVSQWEPLSMNALIEYTKRKEAEGAGEFNQGRPKMWNTQVKVT